MLNFKISEFYIKLDKKLILTIENIEYSSKKIKTNSSIDEIRRSLELLPKVLKWFEKIDIKNISINDNNFNILLNEDILNAENKFFVLNSKIDVSSKQVTLNIEKLYLKDYKLLFKGVAKLDYFSEEIKYFGDIFYENLKIQANIDATKDRLNFFVRSDFFENLHFLKKYLDLPDVANLWMYDNVKGDFKLDWFYGEFDLNKNELIEKSLEGEAFIENAKIRFENSLDEILTSKLKVGFNNSTLHFDLIDAKYKDKILSNSFVTIYNIADEKQGLVLVNIETNTALDKEILDILKAYEITVPVLQKVGTTDAKLLLSFPYAEDKEVGSKGEFIVGKSDINIAGFEFKTNGAKVFLNNDKLHINEASFLLDNMVDAEANITLDLNTLKASGDTKINSVLIKEGISSVILNIKNKNSEISMDFEKDLKIELKDLKTKIEYKDFLTISLSDISKIANYSPFLSENGIKDGNLFIKIKNKDELEFNGFISGFTLPLTKYGKTISSLDFSGKVDKNRVEISSKDNTIKIVKDGEIYLFLDGYEFVYNKKSKQETSSNLKAKIDLKNFKLFVEEQEYKIKFATIGIDKENIDFIASLYDLNLPIKKDNKDLKELDIKGKYRNNTLDISSNTDDLFLRVKDDGKISIKFDKYDIFHDTNDNEKYSDIANISLIGTSSNIIIDKKYKVLSDFFEIDIQENRKFVYLEHDESKMSFVKNGENIDIYLSNINDRFMDALFGKSIMYGGKIDFFANGTTKALNGKLIVQGSVLKDITILNNIMLLVESSPALINPFLAIPAVFGINKLGSYKIEEGILEFIYSKDKINIKKLHSKGNGMDFDGDGEIDLEKNLINAQLKVIFLKVYSSFFEHIPILNYILLGDEKRVETQVFITGNLKDPNITTNLIKDGFFAPVNIVKRVFTTPNNLYNNINKIDKKEDKKP